MSFWPFRSRRLVEPVLVDEVEAAPPPDPDLELQRDVAGLTLQRERILTASLAGQIQETLAAGVLLELRGGKS